MDQSDWQALFRSEGYRRLKDRELGIKRPFTDDDFRMFLSSDSVIKKGAAFQHTLEAWSRVDVSALGEQSMRYLPPEATIKACVYPLIKPRPNSYVWDTQTDPAIMLYLDPSERPKRLSKTVIHELHHIGFASCCPNESFKDWVGHLPEQRKQAIEWTEAFGEGYAVLAAAGGPKNDPMAAYEIDVRNAWNHGIIHLAEDMRTLTVFLTDCATGKLSHDLAESTGMGFFGVQGPWYTVGYVQATTIERVFGHEKLMACFEDPRMMLPTYNQAVTLLPRGVRRPPMWSHDLIDLLIRY